MIILIDNFDSFTYNIVQAYQQLGASIEVVSNHLSSLSYIREKRPSLVVLGPGPGSPRGAGVTIEAVCLGAEGIPVWGICLGHQAIGEYFGGLVVCGTKPMHGKCSPLFHTNTGLFTDLPQGFVVTRYHSLVIDPSSLPASLQVTAWTQEGEIMGIQHKTLPIQGVQFHPESVASTYGIDILQRTLLSTV